MLHGIGVVGSVVVIVVICYVMSTDVVLMWLGTLWDLE